MSQEAKSPISRLQSRDLAALEGTGKQGLKRRKTILPSSWEAWNRNVGQEECGLIAEENSDSPKKPFQGPWPLPATADHLSFCHPVPRALPEYFVTLLFSSGWLLIPNYEAFGGSVFFF